MKRSRYVAASAGIGTPDRTRPQSTLQKTLADLEAIGTFNALQRVQGVQPGITWLYASDPVVFFGSVSYLHNFKRSNVFRTVLTWAPAESR